MRYENEPCCGCGQALSPGTEDVVVCPDCGAPMHRACWRAAGGCPLAARHGGGFAWTPTILPDEPADSAAAPFDAKTQLGIICPTCGENCPPGAMHCEECGTEFEEHAQAVFARLEQENLRREQYLRENFPAYIVHGREVRMGDEVAGQPMEEIALQLRGSHRSVRHYLERFERDGRVGWNWAAFVFGPYWYFFRKLYKPALLLAGLLMAVTLAFAPVNNAIVDRLMPQWKKVTQVGGDAEALQAAMAGFTAEARKAAHEFRWKLAANYGLILALQVAAGLWADPLLRKKIFGNIARANEDVEDTPIHRFGRHQLLIRLGGISFIAPLLYFFAWQFLPGVIFDVIRMLTG